MNTLRPSEEKTLQAFLMALAQLDRPLPTEVQKILHQLGDTLAAQNPQAFEQIDRFASQDPLLKPVYEQARLDLQKSYQSKERAKNAAILTLDTFFSPNLEARTIDILQASDSSLKARSLLQTAQDSATAPPTLWEKGDRILVLTAGGAGLGGAIGQVPGAIIGGALAAIFACLTPTHPKKQVTENR